MEQLENVAGVLGGFGLAVWEIAKNHDRFLVAKSRPPPPSHRVVIKMWSGKWVPNFSSSRSRTGIEELLHVSSGHRLVEVEQLLAAVGFGAEDPGADQCG